MTFPKLFRSGVSKDGLRGSHAVDMRKRDWGELRAYRQGKAGRYWLFACIAHGHEQLIDAAKVRRWAKEGRPIICERCAAEKPSRCPAPESGDAASSG